MLESVDLQKPVDMCEPESSEELTNTNKLEPTMGDGRYPARQGNASSWYSIQYVLLIDEDDQECYEDDMADKHKEKWQNALQDEMDSLHEIYTYDLVELLKGKRALRNKWVFKLKSGDDGNSPRYKADIVLKRF